MTESLQIGAPASPPAAAEVPAPAVDMAAYDGPAAEWVATESLHPWVKNPRDNAKAVAEVAKSIKRFGFGAPILALPGGEIIAGHTRWMAAKSLGMPKVAVRYMRNLAPDEAHILALADNKLGEIAEWNQPLQREVLAEARARGINLTEGTGYSTDTVDRIISAAVKAGQKAAAEVEGTKRVGAPVIAYNIVFDDEGQQNRWFAFVRKLKVTYPDEATIAARLVRFFDDSGV